MASSYPGGLDNLSTSHQDNVDEIVHASTINDNADAINKIEAELGTNPKGSAADVKTRIANTETVANAAIPSSYLDIDGTLAANSDTKVATQKATKTYVDAAVAGGGGSGDTLHTVAASGATQTIDFTTADVWDITLTANCTFTLAGATSGVPAGLTLLLRQDGTGGRTVSWPGSVTWIGGVAPVLHSGASTFDFITLITLDGGTNWYGAQAVSPAPSFAHAEVVANESTTSGTYTDLTTPGPAATITVGASGIALVGWNSQLNSGTGFVSVGVSGATTIAAGDDWSLHGSAIIGRTHVFSGLNPGSTTFTTKYRASDGFQRRSIWAQAI